MDTGIAEEAPVQIYVMGAEKWRSEHEWPLARTQWKRLYLRPGSENGRFGRLATEPPAVEERPLTYYFFSLTPALLGLPQLVYRTPRLKSDVEVTGPICVTLYASCTGKDANFFVKLRDEDERGKYRVLTKGWLKASHREVDRERSLPYQPWHPHARAEKLERGKIYEFLIEVWPTANLFKAGHAISLEIACGDSPLFDFPFSHFPSRHAGKVSIHSSPDTPSNILLPFVDSQLEDLCSE
jgi:hypothetical protein